MKVIILALNAKYIHTNLAVWYLYEMIKNPDIDIEVVEYSINDKKDLIIAEIFLKKPKVLAISCYIWNIELALKISSTLKKIIPDIKIALGGPEVSYDPARILSKEDYIDYVILGEGEFVFKEFLENLLDNEDLIESIDGICTKKFKSNEILRVIDNLDKIPTPYSNKMLNTNRGKIIYIETSRGCVYNCSYCLSSTYKGIRNFEMSVVKANILKIIRAGFSQLKFVDRTFNSNKDRMFEILQFIKTLELNDNVNFHFEVSGDLFEESIIDLLKEMPEGRIQFEIGIQSTNAATLKEVNRNPDASKLLYYIRRIVELRNIHIHVDLIAGLPYEDFNSFKHSFDIVYSLNPGKIQVGFLKLLKGTKIRNESQIHEYVYNDYSPYEVLSNKYIGYKDILNIKNIEELVDKYYNSKRFVYTLTFMRLSNVFDSVYGFYNLLWQYFEMTENAKRSISSRELYDVLFGFLKCYFHEDEHNKINDLLKFDFLTTDASKNIPQSIGRVYEKNLKQKLLKWVTNKKYELGKSHIEIFDYDIELFTKTFDNNIKRKKNIIFFNYEKKSKVSGLYLFFNYN